MMPVQKGDLLDWTSSPGITSGLEIAGSGGGASESYPEQLLEIRLTSVTRPADN